MTSPETTESDLTMLELVKEIYYFELSRQMELLRAFSFRITGYLAVVGLIGYAWTLLKGAGVPLRAPIQWSAFDASLYIPLLLSLLSTGAALVGLWSLVKFLLAREYRYIPSAGQLRSHREGLLAYYRYHEPPGDKTAEAAFNHFLTERFARCATFNVGQNEQRMADTFRFTRETIVAGVLAIMAVAFLFAV